MAQHKSYQGHRNRNAWNVALYIFNTESWYRVAQRRMAMVGRGKCYTVDDVAREMLLELPDYTPDGVRFTFTNIRLALQHWEG